MMSEELIPTSHTRRDPPWNRCYVCGRFIAFKDFEVKEVRESWTFNSHAAYFGGDPDHHPEFAHKRCDPPRSAMRDWCDVGATTKE